jgi:hypothetical protein
MKIDDEEFGQKVGLETFNKKYLKLLFKKFLFENN